MTRHTRSPAILPAVLLTSVLSCLIEGCAVSLSPLARGADQLTWTKRYGGDYAARRPSLLNHNGTTWAAQPSGTYFWLSGVWGVTGRDVFAVGDSGKILHYNGTAWAAQPSGTAEGLKGVWGASGRDVFAVGGLGTILHYDGTSWAETTCAQGGGFACPN